MNQTVIRVTTTGTAGSATGEAQALVKGAIHSIYLDFHASTPATADTTVSYADRGGSIVVVTSSATDVMLHPRAKPVDNANSAITNASAFFVSDQAIKVAVAQGDALTDAVVAYIWSE